MTPLDRCLFFFLFVFFVLSGVSGGQTLDQERMKLIRDEEARGTIKVLPREEVMRLDQEYSYDGLDFKIAIRLENEAKASIVDAFELFKSQIKKAVAISKEEADALSAAIVERNRRRQLTLKQWRKTLLGYESISERSILDAIAGVRTEEQKHEQDVTEKLEDIFDPTQRDLICKLLMGELRVFYARIPFVSRHLKLSKDQVSKYEACRLAQEDLVAGLSASAKMDEKALGVLQERFNSLGHAADDSLNPSQFLFIAIASGFIRSDQSLESYYNDQTDEEKAKLQSIRHVFREIHNKESRSR